MAYEVVWHPKVKTDLAAIAKPDASHIIAKVGAYRVVYAVDHAERWVLVLHVRLRKDVYREELPSPPGAPPLMPGKQPAGGRSRHLG